MCGANDVEYVLELVLLSTRCDHGYRTESFFFPPERDKYFKGWLKVVVRLGNGMIELNEVEGEVASQAGTWQLS